MVNNHIVQPRVSWWQVLDLPVHEIVGSNPCFAPCPLPFHPKKEDNEEGLLHIKFCVEMKEDATPQQYITASLFTETKPTM